MVTFLPTLFGVLVPAAVLGRVRSDLCPGLWVPSLDLLALLQVGRPLEQDYTWVLHPVHTLRSKTISCTVTAEQLLLSSVSGAIGAL